MFVADVLEEDIREEIKEEVREQIRQEILVENEQRIERLLNRRSLIRDDYEY